MSLILKAISKHDHDKVALVGDERELTYGQLIDEIDKSVRIIELSDMSVLGIALDNGPEWVIWDLAALKAGIVCVPLPHFFTEEQIVHSTCVSGVSHLITHDKIIPTPLPLSNDVLKETAKVTFTSGTTASPKGVCLSRYGLEKVAGSIVETLGIE